MAVGLVLILVLVGFVALMVVGLAAVIGLVFFLVFRARGASLPGPNQADAIKASIARPIHRSGWFGV